MIPKFDFPSTIACSALAFAAAILVSQHAAARQDASNPDFTKGEPIPEGATHTWNLGPTGARGWIHSHNLVTTRARQIYITEVAEGSPADGVLRVGDVILGVEEKEFEHDPRVEMGSAITRAEAGSGRLRLSVWRNGETTGLFVPLKPMGAYADTAPYDCQKSRRILEHGANALAKRMREPDYASTQNAITRSLNALALLAVGNRNHAPIIRREAEWASNFSSDNFQVWWYAYVIMFLAEYQEATGDRSFQNGLKRLALESAGGQSIVGSWGHRFANPDGRLGGYGMMNAPGIPLTISLVMARDSGVADPVIDQAIDRSAKLIRFYAGKGSPPYGDHTPWTQTHEDNGKSGMAAVLFNLLGERENSEFFTLMSVSSHGPERDTGHTGNFTNMLWAIPSISLAGPDATGAWMAEFGSWYFDLARTWDFRFPNPGPPQPKPCSFGNWDATGAYLLAYAMPDKRIRLTGKNPTVVRPINATVAAKLLYHGRGWSNDDRESAYDSLSEPQLIERLSNWSPAVRERAAMALSRKARGGGSMPVDKFIEMLEAPSLDGRYGACEALKLARGHGAPAVPALIAQLDHEDLWLRCLAADALAHIGNPAMVALPTMLERITRGATPEDPRAMEQRFFISAVFGQMLRQSIDGVDRDALRKAVVAGLQNQDGRARGQISSIYQKFGLEEVKPLLPVIHEAIIKPAPSGIMFADEVRVSGLRLLAQHHIEGGIEAAVAYLTDQNPWASEKRTPSILKIIESYGAHAQSVVPRLLEIAANIEGGEVNFPLHLSQQKAADIRATVERIQASTERPPLIRIE